MAPLLSHLAFALLASIVFAAPAPAHKKHKASTTATTTPVATPTLLPAIHWDHDLSDVKNLIPQPSNLLYYAEQSGLQDPYLKHMFVHMKTNFTSPTVVLEHSQYVSQVMCDSTKQAKQLDITVDDDRAWNVVKNHWAGVHGLVLLTYADGCGAASNYSRTYWRAKHITFHDTPVGGVARVPVRELLITEGLQDADLVWGTYTPPPKGHPIKHKHKPLPCKPKAGVTDGLDAVNWCSPNFDTRLDKEIGFSPVTLDSFLPALEATAHDISPNPTGHRLLKRDDSYPDSSINSLPSFFPGNLEADLGGFPLNIGPTPDTNEPWANSYTIFSYDGPSEGDNGGLSGHVGVYCVNCGIHGSIDITGHAEFSIAELHVHSLAVSVTGGLHAGLALGIDAQIEYSKSVSTTLLEVPVTPFNLFDIIAVGPEVKLSAEADFDVSAEGKVLAGVSMDFGPFDGTFDFVDENNRHANGFEVTFTDTFEASGEIVLEAGVHLPVSIGVGIEIPLLGWSKTIALVDTPGIKLHARADLETRDYRSDSSSPLSGSSITAPFNGGNGGNGGGGGGGHDSSDSDLSGCNNGVGYDIRAVNDVEINFFDITTIPLTSWTSPPLAHACYQLNGGDNGGNGGGNGGNSNPPGGGTSNPPGGSGPSSGGSGPSSSGSGPSSGGLGPSSGGSSSVNNPPKHTMGLKTATGSHPLFAAYDGNLYYDAGGAISGTEFEVYDQNIIGSDSFGRYFHFYKDVMDDYGVSRVRLSTLDQVPSTASMLVMAPLDADNDPSTPDEYVAVAPDGSYFYPVLCTLKGQFAKFFLAKDVTSGPLMLEKNDLIWTVTGGDVRSCKYVPLIATSEISQSGGGDRKFKSFWNKA